MGEIQSDDVDAAELRQSGIFLQKVLPDFGDGAKFPRRNGFFGQAEGGILPSFDFDKDGGVFINENKVDFAKRGAKIAGDEDEPFTFEKLSGVVFGLGSEEKPFWHG